MNYGKIGTCEWCMQLKIDFLEWWVVQGAAPQLVDLKPILTV